MTTPPGNYEHLKQLEPLIGAWTGEWVLSQDRPTAGIKKGKNLPVTVTYKWDVNKSAILIHVSGRGARVRPRLGDDLAHRLGHRQQTHRLPSLLNSPAAML